MVLLMVLTVGYMPIVMPLLLEGVSIDPMEIARSLVLLMLLPLVFGLAVRARFAAVAGRAAPVLNRVSTLSLILMVVLMLVTNLRNIIDLFGTRGVLASIVFLLWASGWGGCSGGRGATPGACSPWVRRSGTSPQRSWSAARTSTSRGSW